MLNNYDLFSAITAIISAIIMTLPLIKPPPKYPSKEIAQASVPRYGGTGVEMEKVFANLNKDLYDSWIFQRKCTGWALMILVLSVVWGLVGAAVG